MTASHVRTCVHSKIPARKYERNCLSGRKGIGGKKMAKYYLLSICDSFSPILLQIDRFSRSRNRCKKTKMMPEPNKDVKTLERTPLINTPIPKQIHKGNVKVWRIDLTSINNQNRKCRLRYVCSYVGKKIMAAATREETICQILSFLSHSPRRRQESEDKGPITLCDV